MQDSPLKPLKHVTNKPWNKISSPKFNEEGKELDISSESEYDPGLLPDIGRNAYLKKSFSQSLGKEIPLSIRVLKEEGTDSKNYSLSVKYEE